MTILNSIQQFFLKFTTTELVLVSSLIVLFVIVIFMIVKIKKLSFNFYAKSVSQTVESQTQQIVKLERELSLFKREDVGVIVKWAPAREDKAAYLLTIYNDTPEKIYNLSIEIDKEYSSVSQIHFEQSSCESQKQVLAFFMPGGWSKQADKMTSRDGFVAAWMKNKLKPLKFTVKYTTSPIASDDPTKIEIEFNRTHLTKHMANKIRNTHKKLTVLPSAKSD